MFFGWLPPKLLCRHPLPPVEKRPLRALPGRAFLGSSSGCRFPSGHLDPINKTFLLGTNRTFSCGSDTRFLNPKLNLDTSHNRSHTRSQRRKFLSNHWSCRKRIFYPKEVQWSLTRKGAAAKAFSSCLEVSGRGPFPSNTVSGVSLHLPLIAQPKTARPNATKRFQPTAPNFFSTPPFPHSLQQHIRPARTIF